jgi:DNA-binding NarL/FixJ family response regulator
MAAVARFLIADDHAVYRAGLRLVLQLRDPSADILEAADGPQAVETATRDHPDIAILDLGMPLLNGIETAARILAVAPDCKILMLSTYSDENGVLEAFRRGAVAYVLKSAPVSEIGQALDAAVAGEKFVSPGISSAIADRVYQGELDASPLAGLTGRQREILQLIAEGQSTKEIAFQLGLSGKTVETHRRQIMERLRIYDVASLVRFAMRAGLVRTE